VAGPVSKVGWKIVGGAATAAGGAAASRSVDLVHRKLRRGEAPLDPAHPDTAWREAIIWALVSAIAVSLARLAAERMAATGWVRATGALPPGMEPVAEQLD
jgi:hypothetical protein